jgi:methionyl-tRNA formyltransferase
MTPKEKAKELFNKMCNSVDELLPLDVKECALIAVDEIMQHAENSYYNKDIINGAKLYWKEVKKEIEKL